MQKGNHRKGFRNMSKDERLTQLVRMIADGSRYTADGLASQLNTTPRTIYRDITALHKQGWKIPGDAGVGYMFRGRERSQ